MACQAQNPFAVSYLSSPRYIKQCFYSTWLDEDIYCKNREDVMPYVGKILTVTFVRCCEDVAARYGAADAAV